MTIISHSHQFVFIHIYKSGGTSIANALLPYSRLRDKIQYSQNPFIHAPAGIVNRIERLYYGSDSKGGRLFSGLPKHATAQNVYDYVGHNFFMNSRVFAVVRNPYDWLSSLYHYIQCSRSNELYSHANYTFSLFCQHLIKEKFPTQSSFVSSFAFNKHLHLFRFQDVFATQSISSFLDLPDLKLPYINQSKNSSGRVYSNLSSLSPSVRANVDSYLRQDLLLFDSIG